MKEYYINTADLRACCPELRAGDRVLLSGRVFTARDAAHKRLLELIDSGSELPVDLKDACVYYAGPTPTPPGAAIGSCGPTTSCRMDRYAPGLLELGLCAMIGKGDRSEAVCQAIMRSGGVYFCAVGGAGALYAKCVLSCREVAFGDLGCESIKCLEFKDFPVVVGIDCTGGSLFVK